MNLGVVEVFKKILIIFLFLLFVPFVNADEKVELYLFYGTGCPHCEKMISFLDGLDYPTLEISKYEVYFDDENRKLFEDMASRFGENIQGVPTVFIDDKIFVGYNEEIASDLELEIQNCLLEGCEISEVVEEEKNLTKTLTIPAVLGAALVDAINPCAFAVLILLMTTVLASGVRRRALLAGLAFSFSIFISYFLIGIGLYGAIQVVGFSHIFYIVVAILAILLGLFNLKDYLWYRRWFIMEVPMSWRPKLKGLLRGVTSVPGAFLIGFLVSLFLLPCTSGPYIVILGLLSEVATRNYALFLLVLYNLVFVLPMILITLIVYFGLSSTKNLEEFRVMKLKVLHLIAGVIMLLLGIGMLIAIWFGFV